MLRWGGIAAAGVVLAGTVVLAIPGLALEESRTVRWAKIAEGFERLDAPRIEPRRFKRNVRLYRWIRKNVPAGAVILTPPGIIDFRLGARRAIFVDWKGCPMKGHELVEWRRRMFAVMGLQKFPAVGWKLAGAAQRRYLRRPLDQLAQLARREDIDFILARRAKEARIERAGLRLRLVAGGLALYQVLPKRARE